jgi:hypothetical protein
MEIQLYKALTAAGISSDIAADLTASLERDIREKINDARKELATKDFVEAKLESAKSEIIKWNVASIFAAAGLALAATKIFH